MHIFTRYFVLSTDNKKKSIYFGECETERHEFLNVLHSHKTKLKIFVPGYKLKQSTCPGMKVSACFVISSGFFLCVWSRLGFFNTGLTMAVFNQWYNAMVGDVIMMFVINSNRMSRFS